MTKYERLVSILADQLLLIRHLESVVRAQDTALCKISNIVSCCGGPLNDNVLGYSKEQLVTFQKIKESTVVTVADPWKYDEYYENERIDMCSDKPEQEEPR